MKTEETFAEKAYKHDHNISQYFVNNLRQIMKDKKITRVELAKKLNMPYTTLCDWCSGRIYPKYEKIERIAEALKVKPNDLSGISINEKDIDNDLSNEVAKIAILNYIPADTTPKQAAHETLWFTSNIAPELLTNKRSYFGLRVDSDFTSQQTQRDDWFIFLETDTIDEDGIYCLRKPGCIAFIIKVVLIKDGFLTIHTYLTDSRKEYTETYSMKDIGTKIEVLGKAIRYSAAYTHYNHM